MSEVNYLLVRGKDSRKWHWFDPDADECFCGAVKSFAIEDQVSPASYGEREVSQTCRQAFRAATRPEDDPDA